VAGSARPSFVSNLLENEDALSAEDINDIKFAASSMYGGVSLLYLACRT
jgi:hypothetical protein